MDDKEHKPLERRGKDPTNGRFLPGHNYAAKTETRATRRISFRGTLREKLEQVDPDGLNKLEKVIESLIATAQRPSRTGIEATKVIAAYIDGTPFAQHDADGSSASSGTVLVLPSNGRELVIDEGNNALLELNGNGQWEIPTNDEETEEN